MAVPVAVMAVVVAVQGPQGPLRLGNLLRDLLGSELGAQPRAVPLDPGLHVIREEHERGLALGARQPKLALLGLIQRSRPDELSEGVAEVVWRLADPKVAPVVIQQLGVVCVPDFRKIHKRWEQA